MVKILNYEGEIPENKILVTIMKYDEDTDENYLVNVLEDKQNTVQPDIFVIIKIPLALIPTVQDKISQLILMFSDLGRIPRGEYLELSNIALKFVPSFLSKAEFTALKSAGVVFDSNIEDLYSEE